jgi:hypothetical protein
MLPGALLRNAGLKYVCKPVALDIVNSQTRFTRAYGEQRQAVMTVGNGEGAFFADEATLDRLEGEGRVVFTYRDNPNGSARAIAGIVDREVLDRLKREQGEVDERDQAPLSFALIRRLFSFTAPYQRKMRWLMFLVLARAVQMPVLAWAVGAIISGPVAKGDESALMAWVGGFLAFAVVTEITFAFRIKLALLLGQLLRQLLPCLLRIRKLRLELLQPLLPLRLRIRQLLLQHRHLLLQRRHLRLRLALRLRCRLELLIDRRLLGSQHLDLLLQRSHLR